MEVIFKTGISTLEKLQKILFTHRYTATNIDFERMHTSKESDSWYWLFAETLVEFGD